jgi:flagellar biosynthesis GTPase FlhF
LYSIEGKIMHIMTLLLLLVVTTSVHAEVYKCYTPSKKVSYQPTPCTGGSEKQNVIEIEKQSPQQIEDAQRQLNAVEAERMQRDEAAQLQHDKELEQRKLDAVQREATAARQEAIAARQEAEAARQQAQTPVFITYPRYNNVGNYPHYDYRNNQSPVITPPKVPQLVSPYQPHK